MNHTPTVDNKIHISLGTVGNVFQDNQDKQ